MEVNTKDQHSAVKLAWEAPKIVNLESGQAEGKLRNRSYEYTSPTSGANSGPS